MILFADYSTLYLFAIFFALLIGLSEIFALICDHMLSGTPNAHLDHYDSITTDHINRAFHYLNIGRLPTLVVLYLLAGSFGLTSILLQHAYTALWQPPLPNLFAVPASLLFTIIAVYYTGEVAAPWTSRNHSLAITEEEYVGSMTLITGHQVTSGNPCEGKLTDQSDQIHYLLLGPKEGKTFTKGNKVLAICRLSTTRYLTENNPWFQILRSINRKEV